VTKITLNGKEIEVDPSKPLIAVCHKEDESVPHYCYHPGLSPVGSCRICQVEVQQGKGPPRVVVACRTPISEGMVVNTQAPKAHEARRECLEFLLKNHPLDCPICDKAGECTLQDYSFDEGQGVGRTSEPRRKLEKRKDLGDVIVLDQERCILCSRCVRFMEEIPKTPQLVVGQRGSHSVIETFADRPLTGNYQGNVADVCPVGALTLKEFRFQARVWNLHKVSSTCAECSRGCSITTEVLRKGEVKRFRPRENQDVNGWWMCDTGRFASHHANADERLAGATIRAQHGFKAADTHTALEVARDALLTHDAPLIVASPFLTVEEGESLKALATKLGVTPVFASPAPNDLKDDLLHTGDPCPNRRGLSELGFEGLTAAEVMERAGSANAALFVGERIMELLGDACAELPTSLRAVVFDCHASDAPAVCVNIGVPNHVERQGTWVNIDGHRGSLGSARPMPDGVWLTARSLDTLRSLMSPEEAQA
jgi:NADH-quinone oxidoreductase subunit G